MSLTMSYILSNDVIYHIVNLVVFTPETKQELIEAVLVWYSNEDQAKSNYGHISYWNIRNVKDLSNLFSHQPKCKSFNEIFYWDTFHVTNMSAMFDTCTKYNQPVNFDTKQVCDMSKMFNICRLFN